MKKGCFFKSFFAIIILVGVGYHLYTEYGREFLEDSKDDLLEMAYENLLEELDELQDSDYSDSLKLLLSDMAEKAEEQAIERSEEEIEEKMDLIKEYLEDGDIDLDDYNEIKKLLEEYEGQ